MNDNVAVIVDFQVQGQGAGVINAHLQLITQAAERTARDASRAFTTLFGANFFADLGARFISGFVDKIKSGIVEIVTFAARTHELQISLTALGKANNISSAALNDQVQALRAVNIQTQAATQVLSQFVAVGLPLAKVSPLAQVAKDLAVISGMNTQDEFAGLVTGITTLQTRVLRTHGAFISVEQAEAKFAATAGKTTDELTEQEKQLAVLNAVIEFGSRVTGTYDAAMSSASKQVRSFTRVQQDFADAVGSRLEPALLIAVKVATFLVEGLTKVPQVVLGVAAAFGALTLAVTIYNTQAILAAIPLLASFVKGLQSVVFWMIHFRTALEETQVALTATAGWIGLIALVAGVAVAIYQYSQAEEKAIDISQTRVDAVIAERAALQEQSRSLGDLATHTNLTTKEQASLLTQYQALNVESQSRVGKINDEADAARKLQSEISRLIQLRTQELELMARVATAQLIAKIQELNQTEQRVQILETRIEDLRQAEERVKGGGNITEQFAAQYNIGGTVGQLQQDVVLQRLHERNLQLQSDAANLINQSGDMRREASELSTKQNALANALGTTSDALVDQGKKYGNVTGAVDEGKKLITDFRREQDLLTPSIQQNVSALDQFTNALNSVNEAVEKQVSDRRKRINALINTAAETAAQMGDPANAGRLAQGLVDFDTTGQLKRDLEVERAYKVARDAIDKQYGLTKERHQKNLSELEQLQKKIRELEKDLTGFRNLSSPEFVLRFRQEGLERQVKDLEHILDLRRQIGIPLNQPLPADLRAALGSDDVRAAKLAQDYAEQLQLQLDRKNAIIKLTHEQRDAEEELARAVVALQVPVVDAFTRAQTRYVQNIRERRSLEQDLTADIAIEVRKRAEAEGNAARDIQQAQAEAFRDRVKQETDAREELMRAVARSVLQRAADPNEAFRGNELIGVGRDLASALSTNPQVRAVQESNKLLTEIAANTSYLNPQKQNASAAATASPVDILGAFTHVNSGFGQRWGRAHTGLDLAASTRGVAGEFVGQPFAQGRVVFAGPKGDYGNLVAVEDMATGMVARFGHLNDILANVGDILERGGTVGTLGATGNARGPHIHYELRVGGRAVNPSRYPNIRPLKVGGVGGVLSSAQLLVGGLQSASQGAGASAIGDPVANMEKLLSDYEGSRTRGANRVNAFNEEVRRVSGFSLEELQGQENGLQKIAAATAEINRQTDRRAALTQEAANIDIESRADNLAALNRETIAEDELSEKRAVTITQVNEQARATATLNRLRDPNSYARRLEVQGFEIDQTNELIRQERELIRLRTQAARGYLNDPVFRQTAQNDAETQRLRAAETRARQIVQLEDDVAHAGEDAADRYRIAWLTAIREVQDADTKAVEDEISSLVKLSDATTLHTEQVRAQVLRHLAEQKTVTQATADAIIKVYDRLGDKLDATVDRTFKKLGVVGDIFGGVVKAYGRQLLNRIFVGALGIPDVTGTRGQNVRPVQTQTMQVQAGTVIVAGAGGAGGAAASFLGGGGSSSGGGLLQTLLGGFGGGRRAGATPPFIEGGSFTIPAAGSSAFSGNLFGGEATIPRAQTGGFVNQLFGQGSAFRQFFGQNLGGGKFGGLFAKGSFGFGNSAFAQSLPLLGASIGSSLGGQSRFGSILGGAGGLLAGLGLIAPFGVFAPATATAAAGSLSFLAPLFSNPITAIVGGALLVGAVIAGRNAARRRDEKTRDQLTRDSRSQIQDLIRKVKTDQVDGNSAMQQALQIREQYLQGAAQLKDSKTRNNALATVRELDYDIAQLQSAIDAQEKRQELLQKMIPTFAEGGRFDIPRGISATGYRSGLVGNQLTTGGVDEFVGMFRRGEVFLTSDNVAALGGSPAMRRAGMRGFESGGGYTAPAIRPASSPASSSGRPQYFVAVIVPDEDSANAVVAASNEDVVAQKATMHVLRNGSSGLAGAIGNQLFRR